MVLHSSRLSPLVPSRTRVYPLSSIEEGQLILDLLVSLRFATASQIQRVIFDRLASSPRMARHRTTRSLRRLFDAGLTRRVLVFAPSSSGRMTRQVVHVLSAAGARVVGAEPRWARTRAPKPDQVLVHDFWLMELAVLAMAGCPAPLAIEAWWDDRILMSRKRRGLLSLPNVPDGYLLIHHTVTGKRFPCLLELDLGSAAVSSPAAARRDVARKIEGYLGYIDSGFREEFGIDAPPVVLIITDSERRLHALRTTTARLGGAGRYWFATLDRLRGLAASDDHRPAHCAGREGPFWAPNWLPAHEGGFRSLATRCGV